jgi:predicted site-specific integrase-resolvase
MSPVSLNKRISDCMTAEQAANALGISVATLWRWRAQGLLTGRRVLGRTVFDRAEVETVQRKRRASAAG